MHIRSSPAVHYPLKRPMMLWRIWILAAALGAASLLMWLWSGAEGVDWWLQALLAASVWSVAVWVVRGSLSVWPQGALRWDGQCWTMLKPAGDPDSALVALWVVADMQRVLVLRLQRKVQGHCYVWLEKKWAPERWLDLRRAVYSSACLSQSPQQSEAA